MDTVAGLQILGQMGQQTMQRRAVLCVTAEYCYSKKHSEQMVAQGNKIITHWFKFQ